MLAGMFPGIDGTGLLLENGQFQGYGDFEAVAAGDIDSDGDIDIITEGVNSIGGTVWRNNGEGVFSPIGNYLFVGATTGSNIYGLELADLDGDGDLDLTAAGRRGGKTWLNNGMGQFTAKQTLGTDRMVQLTLSDVDGDDDVDIILLTLSESTSGIYLNDGKANFTRTTSMGFDALNNNYVKSTDLDGDGDQDIVVGNFVAAKVWINGGSSFSLQQTIAGTSFKNLSIGDLDRDGHDDLIFGTTSPNDELEYWKNDGHGHFAKVASKTIIQPSGLALGDFDGDADLDIISTSGLLLNDGAGNFALADLPVPSGFDVAAIADFDGDGDLDALAGGQNSRDVWLNADTLIETHVTGAPTNLWAAPGDVFTYQVIVENKSAWQADSLAVAAQLTGPGTGFTLLSVAADPGVASTLQPGAIPNDWSDEITLPGHASITYQFGISVLPVDHPDLELGDLLRHEVVVTSLSDQTLGFPTRQQSVDERIVLLDSPILGDRLVDSGQRLATGRSRDIALGDLDGDGDLDAFVAKGSHDNQVWINNGLGAFVDTGQRLSTEWLSQYGDGFGGAVELGDLDGDGDLDALVGVGYGARIWINDGVGNFSESPFRFRKLGDQFEQEAREVLLGDFDGDGDLDAALLGLKQAYSNTN